MPALVALAVGCAAPDDGGDATESAPQALYGTLTVLTAGDHACSATQASAITQAMARARRVALTPEFAAIFRKHVLTLYQPCNGPYTGPDGTVAVLDDPFWNTSALERYSRALAAARSSASTTIGCIPGGPPAQADGTASYANTHERLFVNGPFLDENLAGGLNEQELGNFASLIWHEGLHQHGYHDCDSDHDGEGYSSSMPQRAQNAMYGANLAGRVLLLRGDIEASLATGVSTGPAGDFGAVGDDAATVYRLGPATRATFCTNADGSGACTTVTNDTLTTGYHIDFGTLAEAVSYARVEPVALGFSGTDYLGTTVALPYGEYLWGGFGAVAIHSVYVPAGARVRLCTSVGTGAGAGACRVIDAPVSDTAFLGDEISYAEVVPIVTAFEGPGFTGRRVGMSPGAWSGSVALGGISNFRSIVVPPALSAQICIAGGFCQVLPGSMFDASFIPTSITVGPVVDPQRLTVHRLGNLSWGTVATAPAGLGCSGATCGGSFHDRSYVRIHATPAHGRVPTWTGCDFENGDCYVSMLGPRTVSVDFGTECDVADCVEICRADGHLASVCVPRCREDPCIYAP